MTEKGLRFNAGKVRMDLLPSYAIRQMAEVFTKGSEKYAPRNWEKGMNWTSVLASLERHIAKFKSGEDYDEESGLLHMAHAMTNATFLVEYYNIYPQGDDRPLSYLNVPRIGLDIDDVRADFIPAFAERFNLPLPTSWNWSYSMKDNFSELFKDEAIAHEFYLNIPVKTLPAEIPFEPCCYLTSRSIPQEITEKWIESNGFPCSPVISVPFNTSKVEAAKAAGIEVFIDDRFENFVELNNAGISCYLFDAPHNQRYNVGHKRIKSLSELPFFR